MFFFRPFAVGFAAATLMASLAAAPAFAGQGARPRAAEPVRPQAQSWAAAQGRQARVQGHPGEEILSRLSSMTPEQLEQALSKLPPAQRANIERRIQNFQKLPPAAQQRRLDRLAKLNSLPPREQQQVRKSMRDFNALPQDRKTAINKDLRQMSRMPENERQSWMNSEEFRNRYSPDEQRIVRHLAEIQPSAQSN